MMMASTLPEPRGPVSEQLLTALRLPPHRFALPKIASQDALTDEDLQLTLYCCYELHYRGLPGLDENWEWAPSVLELRGDQRPRSKTGCGWRSLMTERSLRPM